MRVRTVEHSRVVFGQVLWGGPEIVVPLFAGSTYYAETIRCRSLDGTPPGDGVSAYVSSPLHVRNLDGSLTIYEIQGGRTVRDDTLRDPAALAAWDAWCGGVGVEDVQR
jgi:hypothetical protein